jgi:EAL domain-containing protein (putative c-di-GMP-specific phosphodiesterase class I)
MKKEDLHHWQDTKKEIQQSDQVFEKFEKAGLLEELDFIIKKRMSDAAADEAYNDTDFSGN